MIIPDLIVNGYGVGIGITETAQLLQQHPELKPLISALTISNVDMTIVELQARLENVIRVYKLCPQTRFKSLSIREKTIMWIANRVYNFTCQFIVHVNNECGTESFACHIVDDKLIVYEAQWDDVPDKTCKLIKLAC